MSVCELCGDPSYMGSMHPCCKRLWNGRYCLSCESSKKFWRSQHQRRKGRRA